MPVRALIPVAAVTLLTGLAVPAAAAPAFSSDVPGLAPHVAGLHDLGPAAGEQHVVLTLKSRDETGLDRFLADPAHPALSAAQYQQRFGPAPADEQATEDWLSDTGVHVQHQQGSQVFSLRAPAPRMAAAFHTQVHRFRGPGFEAVGAVTPGSMPARVAVATAGVVGLTASPPARVTSQPASAPAAAQSMWPQDFTAFYDVPAEPSGEGQKIAIIGWMNMDGVVDDLATFQQLNNLPDTPMTVDYVSGKPSSANGQLEWALDTQYAAAMAPGIDEVHVYASWSGNNADLTTTFAKWADEDAYPVASASFAECEIGAQNWINALEPVLAKAEAQGQTLLAGSGDWGTDCYGGVRDQRSYPASSPHAIAVGGTDIIDVSGHVVTGWSDSGGGESALLARPSWQSATIPNGTGKRALPDLAFAATHYNVISGGSQHTVSGTSASTPVMAAFVARAHQLDPNLGFPGRRIYSMAPNAYTDITTGNNGEPAGPGWDYVTGLGEPVVGTWIAALGAETGNTVTVTNPGNQTATVGTPVSVQIHASDSAQGQTLTYSATGLPGGVSIDSDTGLISGTPTTEQTTTTTVTAKDTTGASGTTSFGWTVSPTGGGDCTGQLLTNPGFEAGGGWTASSGVLTNATSGHPAHGGSRIAWFDGYGQAHTDTLSQSVAIPSGCQATLTFYLHIDTSESGSTAYDKFTLTASGNTLANYSNVDRASGYVQHTVNLSAYAGQTVTLKFTGVEDSYLQTSFVVDDTAVTLS